MLALAALALQVTLPGLHPQHGAAALRSAPCVAAHHDGPIAQPAGDGVAAHDALACPLCATIAQGRAGALVTVPAVAVALVSRAAAPVPPVRLLAAPALTRAAPRG
ncbi:MAG: hypothetical protein SF182_18910, partial [Deltaproteobacteria bacterium]|nr:hypothetical protein [Deltaproteobacteria bacterium]